MLTKSEITTAPPTIDSTDKEMWLALIRANTFYRGNKVFYPDVESEIENASGTIKGSMLNVILDKIEALGPGEASIRSGDEGLNWSQSAERDALVKYGLSILYDATEVISQTNVTSGNFGDTQVRQRSAAGSCMYCNCFGSAHRDG